MQHYTTLLAATMRSHCNILLLFLANSAIALSRSFEAQHKAKKPIRIVAGRTKFDNHAPFQEHFYPKPRLSIQTVANIRGGEVDASRIVNDSYGWLMSLGAPSALVAGAVIGSLYEFNRNDNLELERKDGTLVKTAKKIAKLLLVFAFALELLSIFVVTVMGTVLMSKTIGEMAAIKITSKTTPISFLRENFEFEYLTARVTFLVGLMNWLAAICLHFLIPSGVETRATRVMDKLIASILATLIVLMLSFYNNHVTVYDNIVSMIIRYKLLAVQNYMAVWPPKPLSFVLYVCVGSVLYFLLQCFLGKE